MRKLSILVLLLTAALSLKSQWYKEEPKSTLFYSTSGFPGIGGDIGVTDSLYVGLRVSGWQFGIDSTGVIFKYNGIAPPAGYVLTGTGTSATFQAPPSGSGSVTNVSSGNFSPLFNVNISTPTTTPVFSFTPIAQSANLFYASPYSGGGLPNFRTLRSEDFTGTIGTGGYVLSSDGLGGFTWIAAGGGGATYFTDLLDVPSSYTSQARKLVAVNSTATGLEFISQLEEGVGNLRIGTSSSFGAIYNTVIGQSSRMGVASSRNTYIGYGINAAGNSYNENTIIGPASLAVNAGTMTIMGSVVNHARINGLVAIGSYITLPTTGGYASTGANAPIYIGYNITNNESSTTKGNIFIGRNISTSGFTTNNTTAAIVISQDPVIEEGMQNSVGLGYNISLLDGEPNVTVIGNSAKAYLDGTYGSAGGQSIALGYFSAVGAWRAMSLGAYSQSLGVSSTAIGFGAYSNKAHSDSWGRGAYNDVQDATLIYGSPATGANNIGTIFLGTVAAKHTNPAMPGTETLDLSTELNAGTAYTTLTTTTGRDANLVPTLTDVRGGELRVMAGASTGTAAGGDLAFGVTLAGGVSNNTENTWDEALRIKGADAHIYITVDPDNDNTNTKVLSRDPITHEVEETDLPTQTTFQQLYGIISLKL